MSLSETGAGTAGDGAAVDGAADGRGASAALQQYRVLLGSLDQQAQRLTSRDRQLGSVRVALFFAAIALLALGYFAAAGAWFTTAGGLAIAAFLGVVVFNETVRDRLDALRRRMAVLRRLIARLERDWSRLEDPGAAERLAALELPEHQRDVATDLDLFGKASLFQLVSMAATTPGIETLARWLAGPALAPVARQRSRALGALAPRREERLRFYTLAREIGQSSGDPRRFVAWATGPSWLDSRRWLWWWANLSAGLAAALVLVLIAALAGIAPGEALKTSAAGLVGLVVVNLGLSAAVLGPAHEIFSIAMANRRAVDDYQELFAAARWLPADEPDAVSLGDPQDVAAAGSLAQIRHALLEGDDSAVTAMAALRRVARAGALKQSAATFLLYLPLQALGLWDVRVLRRLEQWQARYGQHARRWFESLGEMEALLSLAALRDEYPDWAEATWRSSGEPAVVEAESLGHPLLGDAQRVSNDVTLGPPGHLLLVTGSNMSGKSTMLRSVGLNVALAGAGAPVCADRFQLPSVEMATSIRVSDDVSEGVSFYMAELHRLKTVVDQARRLVSEETRREQPEHDRVLLFLLDEILQGTNSRERQIAVVQVLRHLADCGAIGAISTHDLELADEPELQRIATTVHFRETIRPDAEGNEQMTFDYKMRSGVSPTTNALRLLEMVGLGRAT